MQKIYQNQRPPHQLEDGVYIDLEGRLLNVPFTILNLGPCTCECDGSNPHCEQRPRGRCVPCIINACPEYKTYGPKLDEVPLSRRVKSTVPQ